MPRKPDRFEREVSKRSFAATALSLGCRVLSPFAVTALLRKEHRWVERMIKGYAKACIPPGNERCVEAWEAVPIIEKVCSDIVEQLKQRRK